ncbi:MAG: DUF4476 domain-containing protein [Flavisolibacter sp.]
MKNIFTFLLGGLITSSAFANNITISLPNSNYYQVLIDGNNVNGYNNSGNTVYLNNVQYGQHSIEVYRMRSGFFGNRNSLVYSSSFNSSPQYDLNIAIDNGGRVQMYQSASNDYYGRNGRGNNQGYGDDRRREKKHRDRDGDDDDDRGYQRNGNYGNDGGYNNGGYNHGVSNSGVYNNGGYNNRSQQAMNDYDFNRFFQGLRSQWNGKLATASNGLSSNYFNAGQVRQVLQLFPSENDRLDLAKLSFKTLVDQQNFRQLYDLFSYQGQSELDRYISNNRY